MPEIKYEIVEKIAKLSTTEKGWSKELNLVSWDGRDPKYDLRSWSENHEKTGKGITLSENEIIKLVCVDSCGNVGSPCGACREYMIQLSKDSKNIEILKNIDTKEIVKLGELIPDWWGKTRV